MVDGITVKILGDYGPFSRSGIGIGYLVTIGQSSYLIDCGVPVFQKIGGHGLKEINGLIITHCHDDHKRWFTDLALFHMYAPDVSRKLKLITTDDIVEPLRQASEPALGRSLSHDSKRVVDIAFQDYVNYQAIGPRGRFRIRAKDTGYGKTELQIVDSEGNDVEPSRAKIIVSLKSGRPRMLFRDPEYQEWVDPESFYPFSSTTFYEGEKNIFKDKEGFTIEPIRAPVWHGVPAIGVKIKTAKETLIFSSDTMHDITLWKQLYQERRKQNLTMSAREFESAPIIHGEINDFVERIWSEERYVEAVNAFHDAMVIHDISCCRSVVHTDYERLEDTVLKKEKTLLTHSPDTMTSEWVLVNAGKSFKIEGDRFFEIVDGKLYSMNADIYYKDAGKYYVGYKSEKGSHTVYGKGGVLRLSAGEGLDMGEPLFKVVLYEDISGKYFPKLESENVFYFVRKEGKVEQVEFTDEGSQGKIVTDHRGNLLKGDRNTEH